MGNILKKYNLTKAQWEVVGGAITGDTLPIGAIMPYTSKTTPSNWLPCNGQAVSRTTYADLFAIIGTQFGEGDGSTTFNVPDLNDYKVPIGYDRFEEQSSRMNLGTTGGEETHKLTINEMPSHAHNMPLAAGNETIERQYNTSWLDNQKGNSGDTAATGVRTAYAGASQPHNNMQPYVTTNYIIKAFQSAGVVAQVSNTKSESTTDTYSCDYINNKLNDEDVSSQITLDDGYTKTINFAIKQNNIIHINMIVDFTATTVVNQKIGNHTFNLKKDCRLPIYAYGDGYTGGFGSISFYTDGRIYLVAYSGSRNPIKQITCNGNLY